MSYKIGFRLDDGKMIWLKRTYASKSYAEKVMMRERVKLLDMGIKLNIPYIVPVGEKPSGGPVLTPKQMSEVEQMFKDKGKKAVAMVQDMPGVSTAKNPRGGHIEVKGNPYKYNYSAELTHARKYFKDAVIVVCYNQADLWASRKAAKDFYTEGVYACEGAERDRYVNVVLDLKSGKNVALDDWY